MKTPVRLPREPLARQARVVERLDRHFEQEALLRVHPLRFAREDAEVLGVEAVDRRRGTRPSVVSDLAGRRRVGVVPAHRRPSARAARRGSRRRRRAAASRTLGVSPPPGTRQRHARRSRSGRRAASSRLRARLLRHERELDGRQIAEPGRSRLCSWMRLDALQRERCLVVRQLRQLDRRPRQGVGVGPSARDPASVPRVLGAPNRRGIRRARRPSGSSRRASPGAAAERGLQAVAQLHRHQRVQAHRTERLARVELCAGAILSTSADVCRARRSRAAARRWRSAPSSAMASSRRRTPQRRRRSPTNVAEQCGSAARFARVRTVVQSTGSTATDRRRPAAEPAEERDALRPGANAPMPWRAISLTLRSPALALHEAGVLPRRPTRC